VHGDLAPGARRAGQREPSGRFDHGPDRGRSRRLGRGPGTGQGATSKELQPWAGFGPCAVESFFSFFLF
jgi:hypothetical protein